MTIEQKALDLVTIFGNKRNAIFYVQGMIEENVSVLEMLKIHGTERNRVPVLARIDHLRRLEKTLIDS